MTTATATATATVAKSDSNHLKGDPIPKTVKPTGSIGICAQGLAEILGDVFFCCDPESSRYALGSVLVEFTSQETVAIGTDGRRLSVSRTNARTIIAVDGLDAGERFSLMIPKSIARVIASRVTTKATGSATIMIYEKGFCRISWRDRRQERYVTFQADDGRFPKWQDVLMDQTATIIVKGEAGELTETIGSILDPDPVFSWDLKGSKHGTACSEFTRDSSATLDKGWKVIQGDDFNVSLNIAYIHDFVRTIAPSGMVTLYAKDATSAVELHFGNRTYVVMPCTK